MMPQEYLLNNILDKNIQDLLRPTDLLYPIFFQSKHVIYNNFITPIGWRYKFLSCIVNIAYVLALASTVGFYRVWNPSIQVVYPYLRIILTALSNFTLFLANVVNADLNVDIILNTLSARKTARCRKNELKDIIITNWCKVIFLILVYFVYVIYPSFLLGWQFPLALNHLVLMLYDLGMVHATSIVKLLRKTLDNWLAESRARSKKLRSKGCCKMKMLLAGLHWKEMQNSFLNLRKAYRAYQTIFSIPIFLYFCVNFFDSLLFLQIFLNFEKIRKKEPVHNVHVLQISEVMLTFRMSKNIFFICELCYECQKLYTSVTLVHTECAVILGKGDCTNEQINVYKNVLRMVSQFSKISPCYVFVVDAALPCLFASVLSTYFIVLIQFAIV